MNTDVWYVAYTKPHAEHVAQENLLRQNYRVQMPMVRRVIRRKISLEPLFPRYLFFQLATPQQAITPVRSTTGVSSIVRFGMELAVLSDDRCRAIMEFAQSQQQGGMDELLNTEGIRVGQKILVRSGAFAGLEGLVSDVGKERVLVLMSLLGKEQTLGFKATEIAAL
jgi:transcriptional antiterminator RfaH